MNYFNLILEGYYNPKNKGRLTEYFCEKYYESIRNGYSEITLYSGITLEIKKLKRRFQNELDDTIKKLKEELGDSERKIGSSYSKNPLTDEKKHIIEKMKFIDRIDEKTMNIFIQYNQQPHLLFYSDLEYIEDSLHLAIKSTSEKIIIDQKTKSDYKSRIWFKIGIQFALGNVQKEYLKLKNEYGVFTKITRSFEFKHTSRPYFSETINNTTAGEKNIYRSKDKMKKLYSHCRKEGITMDKSFIEAYKKSQEE